MQIKYLSISLKIPNSFFINNKQIYIIMNAQYTEKIKEKVAKTQGKGNKIISKISMFFIIFRFRQLF